MVSEVAPIDLLLQRAGRLHRHPQPRPSGLSAPELALLSPAIDPAGDPSFGTSKHVYHPHLLLRTWLLLKGRKALGLPDEISALIEAVYADADASLTAEAALQAHTAAAVALPGPDGASVLRGGPKAPVHWQNAPTVDVVCLDGTPAECRLGDQTLDLSTEPPAPVIQALRSEAFRVAGHACVDLNRLPRPDWWKQNRQLCGLVPVFLNAEHTTTIADHIMQLHPDLGFTITDTGCCP